MHRWLGLPSGTDGDRLPLGIKSLTIHILLASGKSSPSPLLPPPSAGCRALDDRKPPSSCWKSGLSRPAALPSIPASIAAHCSLSAQRRSNRSVRRSAASMAFVFTCASASSQTYRGASEHFAAQSRQIESEPVRHRPDRQLLDQLRDRRCDRLLSRTPGCREGISAWPTDGARARPGFTKQPGTARQFCSGPLQRTSKDDA